MRRLALFAVICVLQVALVAGPAQAEHRSFTERFNTFDDTRWGKSDHRLGRGDLDPSNVSVRRGLLAIKMPARTLDGGEIYSKELYRYGGYGARMRVPYAPTSITGFFLYRSPDFEHEIDIEIYNDHSRRIVFTTYSNGSRTHTKTMRLPFDATEGFHRYHFRYGPNYVAFYAGGKLMKRWRSGVPNESMHLLVNTWYPNWLGGKKPSTNSFWSLIGSATTNPEDVSSNLLGYYNFRCVNRDIYDGIYAISRPDKSNSPYRTLTGIFRWAGSSSWRPTLTHSLPGP